MYKTCTLSRSDINKEINPQGQDQGHYCQEKRKNWWSNVNTAKPKFAYCSLQQRLHNIVKFSYIFLMYLTPLSSST